MSVRTPNPEQKMAIEHKGGVLLSAGAGSGKTFVLVEHIVYLLSEFKKEKAGETLEEKDIKKFLSSVVMMTFTKKAAGEMATRLFKRIKQEEENKPEEAVFWSNVGKSLNSLYVGTIHGFCHKLISANFFPELSSSFEIIDEDSQKTKIEALFEDWYLDTRSDREDHLNKVILSHRLQLLNSIFNIFSSPDLRNFWNLSTVDELTNVDVSLCIEELKEGEEWGTIVNGRFDLSPYEAHSGNAWYKNIEGFINTIRTQDWNNAEYWNSLLSFFAGVKSWRKPTGKNESLEVSDYVEKIKSFKDFLKSNGESIVAFLNNKESFNSWVNEFYGLYKYIESRYDKLGGLTFSDLEYYVLRGLEDSRWAIEKVSQQYKYFIVDEFQDTSEVQYEILKNLVDRDLSKLFCVGDVKQAIYGFRGGELGVFRSCSKEINLNLELSKNYRSDAKIINLNNNLFDYLFKLGVGFKGNEKDPVEVKFQEYPGDNSESGIVSKIKGTVATEEKITSKDIDILEAKLLFDSLHKLKDSEGTIGILYKNLGPSTHLLSLMSESKMSFTAQVKIPMNQGPIWALFSTMLEGYLSEEESASKNTGIICFGILQWLGVKKDAEIVQKYVDRFLNSLGHLGLVTAFESFLGNLGICDADYEKNFSQIVHLNELAGEDPEYLFNLMEEFGPERISVEFRYGDNPEKIFLMTAHGSKGLEFDHVFLGGIHTNGRRNSDSPLLGKLPGSFKWKIDSGQKDFYKSPVYLLEELRGKKKDFAESKRLFYVACTRAQESLYYADLWKENTPLKYTDDSWITGFRLFEEEKGMSGVEQKELNPDFVPRLPTDDISPPLFQKDNLGIHFKNKNENEIGLLAEVSVTRLATLAQCPRKFYLSNICKLDEEDLERLGFGSELKINDDKSHKEFIEYERPKFDPRKRGIVIHDAISRGILSNFVCPLDVPENERDVVEYPLKLLRDMNGYQMFTERPVKFSLFGQMISGTPDLTLIPDSKNQMPEVWDFKTGRQKEDSELAYWFQLFCYAIQASHEMGLSNDEKIKVALVYVDEKKFVEKVLSKKEIESKLFSAWKNLANFDQVNESHCSSCSFGNLCQTSS